MKFAVLFFMFSTTAFAEDAEEQPSERQVVYKQRTEIDFEGIEIEGALVRPQGALVLDRRRGSFNPLIQNLAKFLEESAIM